MGGGGRRRVPTGGWPAWTGTRTPCHSQGSGAGAGAGVADGVGKAPPWRQRALDESEVAQPCLTVSDPMDCSLRGSPVHGVFQARALEWGAIAFSTMDYYSTAIKHNNSLVEFNNLSKL